MNRKALIIVISIILFSLLYSENKIIDSNLEFNFKTRLLFNIYGPNYQGYGSHIGKKCKLKKNDKLIIEISGKTDKALPKLYFSIVDRNPLVSYWCDITPKNQLYIENIKENQEFTHIFETEVIATPYSMATTCFVFMHDNMNIKTVKLSSCKIKIRFKG